MIEAVRNIVASPTLASIAQNTSASVAIETTLKSIGRPGFILIDKDIDGDTKQYAAAKEFLYQATCLLIYMAAIVPIFKKGGFKLAKKYIYKNTKGFEHFNNVREFTRYHKIAENPSLTSRCNILGTEVGYRTSIKPVSEMFSPFLRDQLMSENPEKYVEVKGAIELSNLIGSVLGLAIIAPQLSHCVIHPALRFLGLEKKNKTPEQNSLPVNKEVKPEKDVKNNNSEKKVDITA